MDSDDALTSIFEAEVSLQGFSCEWTDPSYCQLRKNGMESLVCLQFLREDFARTQDENSVVEYAREQCRSFEMRFAEIPPPPSFDFSGSHFVSTDTVVPPASHSPEALISRWSAPGFLIDAGTHPIPRQDVALYFGVFGGEHFKTLEEFGSFCLSMFPVRPDWYSTMDINEAIMMAYDQHEIAKFESSNPGSGSIRQLLKSLGVPADLGGLPDDHAVRYDWWGGRTNLMLTAQLEGAWLDLFIA